MQSDDDKNVNFHPHLVNFDMFSFLVRTNEGT